MGIDTIAASIGEERVTIEDVYEPYLIQSGLLYRTQKGRMVSKDGYKHLGLAYAGDDDNADNDNDEKNEEERQITF